MSMQTLYQLSLVVNMIDNLSAPARQIAASADQASSRLDNFIQKSQGLVKSGTAMMLLGKEVTTAVLSPVKATFQTQSAIGELASLGIKDMESLTNSAKKFSDTWSGTTQADFITAAYDIKSGIASLSDEGVAKYTEMAGLTAKATKATTAEMTSLFATGYGIYKNFYSDLSDEQFGEVFSAAISESVRAFKTSGSEMAQAIQSLGASATTANVPLEEQMSILGMLQATMSGSEAGTKYRAFIKSAAKAGDELGLSFTDANNQLLSMPQILSLLKSKFGDTIDAAEKMELTKAFGTDEAVALVDLLYQKTGELEGSIVNLHGTMGQGLGVAQKMADTINSKPGEQYQVVTQQIDNLKQEIGTQLLPTFIEYLKYAKSGITTIRDWTQKHRDLTQIIMKVALWFGIIMSAVGGFNLAVGGTGLLFGSLVKNAASLAKNLRAIPGTMQKVGSGIMAGARYARSGIETISIHAMYAKDAVIRASSAAFTFSKNLLIMAKNAIVTGVQALPGLISSVWSFTTALLANPVTWIVIGIIALVAALYLLWKHWDTVTNFVTTKWNQFTTFFESAFQKIGSKIKALPKVFQTFFAGAFPMFSLPVLIIKNWDKIKLFFASLWKHITQIFHRGINSVKNFLNSTFSWFRNSGRKIIDTFVSGIKSAINKPYEIVKGGLAKVRSLLPFSDAKEGPLSTLTLSGKRVFTTIVSGMDKTKELPALKAADSFQKIKKVATISIGSKSNTEGIKEFQPGIRYKKTSSKKQKESNLKSDLNEKKSEGKTVIIQKLLLNLPDVKELQQVLKLLSELRDYAEGEGVVIE